MPSATTVDAPPFSLTDAARVLGRIGGCKRMLALSPSERAQLSSRAGKALWANFTPEERFAFIRGRSKRISEGMASSSVWAEWKERKRLATINGVSEGAYTSE